MIPSCVQYFAAPIDWPEQDWPTRDAQLAGGIDAMSRRYGLRLDPLASNLQSTAYKEYFPSRMANGQLERPGCRLLGPWQAPFMIDYPGQNALGYPEEIRLFASRLTRQGHGTACYGGRICAATIG
jgi:hypothetical protein